MFGMKLCLSRLQSACLRQPHPHSLSFAVFQSCVIAGSSCIYFRVVLIVPSLVHGHIVLDTVQIPEKTQSLL